MQLLLEDPGEDVQSNAAKLLEVTILQCRGHIDQVIFVIASGRRWRPEHVTREYEVCLHLPKFVLVASDNVENTGPGSSKPD